MREINRIILHASYTQPSMDIGAAEIKEWHVRDKGWDDIGYHYVIRRDGTLEEGRPLSVQGAHTYGYNKDSIGICLVGGKKEGEDVDETNFTFSQYEAMVYLVYELQQTFGEDITVHGHNEFTDHKTCPTFYLNK